MNRFIMSAVLLAAVASLIVATNQIAFAQEKSLTQNCVAKDGKCQTKTIYKKVNGDVEVTQNFDFSGMSGGGNASTVDQTARDGVAAANSQIVALETGVNSQISTLTAQLNNANSQIANLTNLVNSAIIDIDVNATVPGNGTGNGGNTTIPTNGNTTIPTNGNVTLPDGNVTQPDANATVPTNSTPAENQTIPDGDF